MATNAKSQPVRGRWVEAKNPWYEQTMFYCDCCGMLIPRKQFVVEGNGVSRRFCGTQCAQLNEQLSPSPVKKRQSSTKD